MEVEKSKVGDKIKFANPDAGWPGDVEFSRVAGLTVGQVYTVAKIIVHSWHTDIYLEEVHGRFNSVQFEAL